MNFRILSWSTLALIAICLMFDCSLASAENTSGYHTDPSTGIVYRKVIRTVERPVVETKVEKKEQTVFRPETVTETVPSKKTVYVPETGYTWQPVLHGRWNPFVRPTITYHHVPTTQWKQRNDVVSRTQTRLNWVAEKRMVDVPQRIVRIERDQKIDYEPVGRVEPPAQATPSSSVSEEIASRLRPLASNATVRPLGTDPRPYGGYRRPVTQLAAKPSNWTQRGAAPSTDPVNQRLAQSINARSTNLNHGASRPAASAGAGYGTSFGSAPFGATAKRGSVNGSQHIAAASVGRMTSDPPRRNTLQSGIRPTDLYPAQHSGYGQPLTPANGTSGIATLPGWSLWR